MARNRVVLTFSGTPGGPFVSLAGWSETFWRDVDESTDALLNAIVGVPPAPPTIAYLQRRRELLTPGWRIDGVKVYPITGGRVVSAAALVGASNKGLFNVVDAGEEQQPYDRLLWKMVSAGGHSRSCRLGGISGAVVDPGGNYEGGPFAFGSSVFDDRLRLDFFPMLIAAQFGLRFTTVSAPFVVNNIETDNAVIAGASDRTPVVVVSGDQSAVFPAGRVIRISGATSPARANGQWTVDSVSVVGGETRFRLRPKRGLKVVGVYESGALVVSITYSVAAMTGGTPIRGVSRKVGRPSGLPRGRRSRRT